MNYQQRLQRLNKFIFQDRLIRNQWVGTDQQGRETACLLAALSPEAGKTANSSRCPAEVMPAWFARLTPWIDDAGTEKHWPVVIRRYADLAGRWTILDPRDWELLDYRVRALCVRAALENAGEVSKQVQTACGEVIELCERAGRGEQISKQEWVKARAAAYAAAADAARAYAAEAAARAYAADAAARAYAADAADAADADRLIDQILDELERTIEEKE